MQDLLRRAREGGVLPLRTRIVRGLQCDAELSMPLLPRRYRCRREGVSVRAARRDEPPAVARCVGVSTFEASLKTMRVLSLSLHVNVCLDAGSTFGVRHTTGGSMH